jgi:hypothetical protein
VEDGRRAFIQRSEGIQRSDSERQGIYSKI